MTAYTGTAALSNVPTRQGVDLSTVIGSYVQTTSFVAADTIKLCNIPAGARVCNIVLDVPIMGTGTTASLAVGDNAQTYATTGQATRFISTTALTTSTAGQVLSMQSGGAAGSIGRRYTTADTVILTVVTAAQTAATTGTLNYLVAYTMNVG